MNSPKDCEKIISNCLSSQQVEDCIIVQCLLKERRDDAVKFHHLFRILANVWTRLRAPKVSEEHTNKTIEYCELWSKLLPVYFEERTITRKGHVLSIHVPDYLLKYDLFNVFYKLEQTGESLHAKMNKLMRRYISVRPKHFRLMKIIQEFEQLNGVNFATVQPKRVKKTPLQNSTNH